MKYSLWYVVPNSLPAGDLVTELPDHRPVTYWVQHTTSCISQSKAPGDGHNCCPKHVELNWIINKLLLLRLFGFLLYQRLSLSFGFLFIKVAFQLLIDSTSTSLELKPVKKSVHRVNCFSVWPWIFLGISEIFVNISLGSYAYVSVLM